MNHLYQRLRHLSCSSLSSRGLALLMLLMASFQLWDADLLRAPAPVIALALAASLVLPALMLTPRAEELLLSRSALPLAMLVATVLLATAALAAHGPLPNLFLIPMYQGFLWLFGRDPGRCRAAMRR